MTDAEAISIIGTSLGAIAEIVKDLKNKGVPDAGIGPLIRESVEAKMAAETDWEAAMRKRFGG